METYSRADILKALRDLGLGKGDLVLFQSRLHGLGRPEGVADKDGICRLFLEALTETIGPEGTLAVPTFSTQVSRFDEPFVVEETPSNYGLFPEYVLGRKDFLRSLHPLVSIAATGPLKEEICRPGGNSGFGARSPFDVLVGRNAKNLFAGLSIKEAATAVHYVEMHYGAPYLYNKLLKWRPVLGGEISGAPSTMNVRYLDYDIRYNLDRYETDLLSSGAVKSARVGGGSIHEVSMGDMIGIGYDGMGKDLYYFLDAPPAFDYGYLPFDGPTIEREKGGSAGSMELMRRCAPRFADVAEMVLAKSAPAARKALEGLLAARSERFFAEAERLVETMLAAGRRRGVGAARLAESYLRFCADTMKEQMEFRRSGAYTVKDFGAAMDAVYSKSNVMEYYMDGLMLSQVLWDNHWRLLRFARNNFFAPFCLAGRRHLEVGPGHGYLALLAFRFGIKSLIAFDVSPQSIRHTGELLESQLIPAESYELREADVQERIPLEDSSIGTAVAGEVLEHISSPSRFLAEMFRVLAPGGAAYVTTAANAPAIDHLYLFKSADQIREAIKLAGFRIERDIEIEAGRIGGAPLLNYGAVLRKGVR